MRRKTMAPSSISIGTLIGIMVTVSTNNLPLGILAFIGTTALGWFIIRMIEKAIWKGADKVGDLLFGDAKTQIEKVEPAETEKKPEEAQPVKQKVKKPVEKKIESGKKLWVFAAVLTLFGLLCTFYLMGEFKHEVDSVNSNIKSNTISHEKYKEGDSGYSTFDDDTYEQYMTRDNALLVLYESSFILAIGSLLAFALLVSFRAKQVVALYALVIAGVGGYLVANSSSFRAYKMSMFYIYVALIFAAAILHFIAGLSKKSLFSVFAILVSLAVAASAFVFIGDITIFRNAIFICSIWADLVGIIIIALLVNKSKQKDIEFNKMLESTGK